VQPGSLTEHVQYFFDRPGFLHSRSDEQDHVIRVHAALILDLMWCHPPQYTIIGRLLEQAVKDVRYIMKSIADKESPCRTPRMCLIGGP
jgi:acetyl-CoA carboxylase carboxyltransferase component